MDKPLVSVICLCYNHERFVEHAIESVLKQTYSNIELIVVDDASTDGSRDVIIKASKNYGFRVILNESNLGNCTSFNQGFKQSKGKYLIDLAADDLLDLERIQTGVNVLEAKGDTYGVHFCDVELISEEGKSLGTQYKRDQQGNLSEIVPSGDIYKALVERYIISAPAMMMTRKVLDELGGYDEQLSYEDFDFWVRSSRNYHYAFTDQVLIRKRILEHSLSSSQFHRNNKHALSTAKVCDKILKMNKNKEEDQALLKRIKYEVKWDLITENWEAARKLLGMKEKLGSNSLRTLLEKIILIVKPNWHWIWKIFYK